MANKSEVYEKEIVECIEAHKDIVFISDIFDHYMGIRSAQFYNLGLEKSEKIKNALNKNRSTAKHHLRTKWIQSENPTLQICAYRILATEDERRAIDQKYSDVTVKGNVGVVTEEAIANLMDKLEKQGRND